MRWAGSEVADEFITASIAISEIGAYGSTAEVRAPRGSTDSSREAQHHRSLQRASRRVHRFFHGRGEGEQVALQVLQIALQVLGHWNSCQLLVVSCEFH